jgi:tRNA modification GTPase
MIRSDETICAQATGTGGAIAVIRVSGPNAIEICSKIFHPLDKNLKLNEQKGYTMVLGEIRYGVELIDEVIMSVFRAPYSYTGENSIEISCHASSFIIKKVLELLIANGASTAQPGEFTQRAFTNGKIDLSQAEAVADIIASTTRSAHKVAMNQMRGGFSKEIEKLRTELLNFASLIELELDFGEEDVEFANRNELRSVIIDIKELADRLTDSFKLGNAIKNGIPVTIIGKPNSGKSTLLNALLMEDKAIVSDIPGTTRDSIEDTIIIDGLEYRFIDTAGLHETTDVIESIGIKRTYERIKQASVILLMDEITDDPDQINKRIKVIRELIKDTGKQLMILVNKTDLEPFHRQTELGGMIDVGINEVLLFISAQQNTGIENLRRQLSETSIRKKLDSNDVIITNVRHYEALLRVSESLERVLYGLDSHISEDLIAVDIRQAIHYLGEITGLITTDEILGNIFKNFCIGK